MNNDRLSYTIALAAITSAPLASAAIPSGSTLAECNTFANLFSNTCTVTDGVPEVLTSLSSHAGTDVSCAGDMRCPGGSGSATYTTGSPCTYTRKLCVSCAESSGVVKITVQSNGLPDHCFYSTVNTADSLENEWEVVFNADVESVMNYSASDFDSSEKTDEILCDISRTSSSNMNSASDYDLLNRRRMLQPEALGTSAGIALTGGYIYNALAAGNADAVESEADTLDVCFSHPSPFDEFHYHFWGSCLKKDYGFWDDENAPDLCRDASNCADSPSEFTLNNALSGQTVFYSASTWDEPIGLARDGHVIIGPYKSDGETWGCSDRDVCNGAFVDGQYVYVGSDTFPYVVGCWGPGPDNLYAPTCSSSGCGEVTTGALQSSLVSMVVTLTAAVSAALF